MTITSSTESVLAAARVTYAREQAQQASFTGAKVNANPTESDLIANDPTLETALEAAEDTASTVTVAVGGGGGSAPASGGSAVVQSADGAAGSVAQTSATPAPVATPASHAAVNGIDIQA